MQTVLVFGGKDIWNTDRVSNKVFLKNSEDVASAPSSPTQTNATFSSCFLNVVTINFNTSIGGHLLLAANPKVYEVAKHIATKF